VGVNGLNADIATRLLLMNNTAMTACMTNGDVRYIQSATGSCQHLSLPRATCFIYMQESPDSWNEELTSPFTVRLVQYHTCSELFQHSNIYAASGT